MSPATLISTPASEALSLSPIPALRRLSLEENGGVVVIAGNVASYYLKQLAQETVLPVLAGRTLQNRVAVVRHRTEKWATAS